MVSRTSRTWMYPAPHSFTRSFTRSLSRSLTRSLTHPSLRHPSHPISLPPLLPSLPSYLSPFSRPPSTLLCLTLSRCGLLHIHCSLLHMGFSDFFLWIFIKIHWNCYFSYIFQWILLKLGTLISWVSPQTLFFSEFWNLDFLIFYEFS